MSGNRHDPVDRVAEWVIEHQARRALYTAECRHPFVGGPCLFVDDDDARNERGLADGGVVTDFGGWEPTPAPYRGKTWLLQPCPGGVGTRIELSFDQRCLDGGVAITPERMAELIRGMHREWERAARAGRRPGWARP